MPVLKPLDLKAEIVWLGRMTDTPPVILGQAETEIFASFDGIAGEVHAGATRLSCSRVTTQYPRGTPIRNTRQISILSAEEMALIAADMGLDRLPPERLGATIVLKGIPDFSFVPPGSRLQFGGVTTLTVDLNNTPCQFPAKSLELEFPGHGARFVPAARGRRGVTAWVEREGPLRLGMPVVLHVPDQRAWRGMSG